MFRRNILFLLFFLVYVNAIPTASEKNEEECQSKLVDAIAYLSNLDLKLQKRYNEEYSAAYQYNIDVNEENRIKMIELQTRNSKFLKDSVLKMRELGYDKLTGNEYVSRQIEIFNKLSLNVLNSTDFTRLMNSISNMQSNYAKAKVCSYEDRTKCDLSLEPEIQDRISKSRDADELAYYWKEWYDHSGQPSKKDFKEYVKLTQMSAEANGLKSYAEDWISEYEDPEFENNIDKIFNEILPFYKDLHAYVRHKLKEKYGESKFSENGNIPIHLLGNLWAQQWNNVIDIITPFPDTPFIDITDELVKQKYTPEKIFEMGDDFFQSLNMSELPDKFWELSVLKKPKEPNRQIICHASAWDLFQTNDVRIKQCTEVTMEHFYIAHHELGHIQYYLQYQDKPVAFRQAPNPGFHEAVGDTIALSVSSPKHLAEIGLIKNGTLDKKSRINELFKQALQKIIFLPFSYTMDKYRYGVFRGDIKEEQWNCKWWVAFLLIK